MPAQTSAAQSLICHPTADPNTVRDATGALRTAPPDWSLLAPGDPGLTRRVKAAGPSWTVQERVGRKLFSRGVWAPTATITRIRTELDAERADPRYARKQAAAATRRDRHQSAYVEDFQGAVLNFLAFHTRYTDLATRLAQAVTTHATPVGSGTVARTQRIPIEERAKAAVIAWMRHQTTGYDSMTIPRIKGQRREVRRMLAESSRRMLEGYRLGRDIGTGCPLRKALGAGESNPGFETLTA